jgi:translation initiation factor 2B subunit (eIF-2B alpha/beta/delta family)
MISAMQDLSHIWQDIRNDRQHGARELLLKALHTLDEYLTRNSSADPIILINELSNLRPEMVGFQNASRIIQKSSNTVAQSVKNLIKYLDSTSDKIGQIAEKHFKTNLTVLCHSRSSILEGVLLHLHRSGKLAGLMQLESRPEYEGRLQAEILSEQGLSVTICPDATMALAVRKADIVLVGADILTPDGTFLGKTGCHPLALTAQAFDKPFYVAAELLKISDDVPDEDKINADITPENILWESAGSGITALSYQFEFTPGKLVTAFITEQGILHTPLPLPESLSF